MRRRDSLPTAEEYVTIRTLYSSTYPVRPLLNALEAKDNELAAAQRKIRLLTEELARWQKNCSGMHGSQMPCGGLDGGEGSKYAR